MNKLEQKLKELETSVSNHIVEIQDLRKQLASEEVKQAPLVDKFGRYMSGPEIGVIIYVLDEDSILRMDYTISSQYDDRIIALGNAFDTRENAERQIKRNELTQRARVFMHKEQFENGVLDWNDWASNKFCIEIIRNKVLMNSYRITAQVLAFTSQEMREQFRKEFSDSDILMILGFE